METNKRPSQAQKIIDYLKAKGSISAFEAMRDLSCMRLAARISEIEDMGYLIKHTTETYKNYQGESVHYTRYILEAVPNDV